MTLPESIIGSTVVLQVGTLLCWIGYDLVLVGSGL